MSLYHGFCDSGPCLSIVDERWWRFHDDRAPQPPADMKGDQLAMWLMAEHVSGCSRDTRPIARCHVHGAPIKRGPMAHGLER